MPYHIQNVLKFWIGIYWRLGTFWHWQLMTFSSVLNQNLAVSVMHPSCMDIHCKQSSAEFYAAPLHISKAFDCQPLQIVAFWADRQKETREFRKNSLTETQTGRTTSDVPKKSPSGCNHTQRDRSRCHDPGACRRPPVRWFLLYRPCWNLMCWLQSPVFLWTTAAAAVSGVY